MSAAAPCAGSWPTRPFGISISPRSRCLRTSWLRLSGAPTLTIQALRSSLHSAKYYPGSPMIEHFRSVVRRVLPASCINSIRRSRYTVRKHLLHNTSAHDDWFHDRGDDTVSVRHTLDADSVVFEVGGYEGKWSSTIVALYDPHLYIFEPVRSFYRTILNRFSANAKVRVYQFGLSDKDETRDISVNNDGSSLFASSENMERIRLKDIYQFILEHNISQIDLIQINIEGGEYCLLPRMLDTGIVKRCRMIQIQFHNNVPNAQCNRQEIRQTLSETHALIYDYPFVWEAWKLRGVDG
jgi:FkbM family methyltransferase